MPFCFTLKSLPSIGTSNYCLITEFRLLIYSTLHPQTPQPSLALCHIHTLYIPKQLCKKAGIDTHSSETKSAVQLIWFAGLSDC